MTRELPERGGRSRSVAAARLAALVADVEQERVSEPPPSAPAFEPPAGSPLDGAQHPPPSAIAVDELAPSAIRSPRPGWRPPFRRIAIGTAFAVLVAAIPALGWAGFQVLLDSRDGRVLNPITDPEAPGYEAIVDPTPTTLVVQTDAEGEPVGLTMLSLGTGEAGGSVVFIPLDTRLEKALYLTIFTLRDSYTSGGLRMLRSTTADRLGLGFSELNRVNDTTLASLVAPVAPLRLDNPDSVFAGDRSFPAGPTELAAEDVGPFLAATREGETDLARLARHELFWKAWLEAIAASDAPAPIPGETGSGLGKFVGTLAQGPVEYATIPVEEVDGDEGPSTFRVDTEQLNADMASAVPFPVAPAPGERAVIRVLNGVRGGKLPAAVTETLVRGGAQISAIGNARRFGEETTRIEYYEAGHREDAEAMREALGAGEIERRQGVTDSVDVNVVIGADVLDELGAVDEDGSQTGG